MKKKKKNTIDKIWNRIVEFFTEEEKDIEEDISIKTLITIFIIGILIITSFYLFFSTSKDDSKDYKETDSKKDQDLKEFDQRLNASLEDVSACENKEILTCLEGLKLYKDQINISINIIQSLKMDYAEIETEYNILELNYSLLLDELAWLQQEINFLNNTQQQEINILNNTIFELYTKIYPYEYIPRYCEDCVIYLSLVNNDSKVLNVKYIIPHNKNKWQIFLHKIKEKLFNIDVNYGWVYFSKYLPNIAWSNYSTINLILKSDIPGGSFELHFKEQDGDEWFYFNNEVLSKEGWVRIKIPFSQFIQPSWASHGNGKQELKSITEIGFTFTSFDRELNKTVYFSVIDGDIFSFS